MTSRRQFLSAALAASLGALPPAIARALDIPARVRTGTIKDVEHVVILMQENRSFDHYFGTMNGVQGFGDRFAIPAPDTKTNKGRTVFAQPREDKPETLIAPFYLNTAEDFRLMRVEGTPHNMANAQDAWDLGRMGRWPDAKHNHSMAYFSRVDMPFQYALAEAFTLCDAYFCSMHSGTNPNRTFHWTGTNVGPNGPVTNNDYDNLGADPKGHGGYDWTTYPERLSAAGINWQVYQDMKDNFTDNPLAGFKTYRAADKATSEKLMDLARRSIRTRDLDKLKEDVLANRLPQVSWIVGTAEGSEHPSTSSPAQGADYTARVLDALTSNPEVWAKTVFLINFDENDGYFDHVPPPAPPSIGADGKQLGFAEGAEAEYHQGDDKYGNRPYGLGPRVPMYAISPWSKGGYVASEVFDHTSVIRFLERRFGVQEPNISAWRRAVCGDLTSCFDFKTPNDQPFFAHIPKTAELAEKARKLGGETKPRTPDTLVAPVQEKGQRPRRATPYDLGAHLGWDHIEVFRYIQFDNRSSDRATVFHLYNGLDLTQPPLRFTLAPGQSRNYAPVADMKLKTYGEAASKGYDWRVIGPNGFFRHFVGEVYEIDAWLKGAQLRLGNPSFKAPQKITLTDHYGGREQVFYMAPQPPHKDGHMTVYETVTLDLGATSGWYDVTLKGDGFHQRLAGHVENGQPSLSDPLAFGPAPLKL
ncbi:MULTISPECIES: phosphocholine-specific phospholipase C [Asticcacaulis]|uniref:phosphocholine-specific phospholipase C n=1 Tax=Asticcacaulis TaxID=76890 RepID=UPI001AEA323C|nr:MULTISPECIES: phospholipase C, phosphocholine-specific [Asticcacaulis]MBP2157529.1 phospholipase C [Asticcacaulis solisilvae]MDR6798574.1 phospholipase C [Asticcacaulis sp. BE141]